jgi:hypothetical protein
MGHLAGYARVEEVQLPDGFADAEAPPEEPAEGAGPIFVDQGRGEAEEPVVAGGPGKDEGEGRPVGPVMVIATVAAAESMAPSLTLKVKLSGPV